MWSQGLGLALIASLPIMFSTFLDACKRDVEDSLHCNGRLIVFRDREPEPEASTSFHCSRIPQVRVESPMVCAGHKQRNCDGVTRD
jgi:hypothetical protein